MAERSECLQHTKETADIDAFRISQFLGHGDLQVGDSMTESFDMMLVVNGDLYISADVVT